jgi:hypothetical protein
MKDSPDPPVARTAGASSRLPWRYAEIGRRRLAGLAARRAAGSSKGGRKDVDIDDHIRLAVREEAAATLGRAGRKLQEAVAALADFDRDAAAHMELPAARRPLLQEAALALWECVVQREAVSITNHDLLDQLYGVTPELWRLMGSSAVR